MIRILILALASVVVSCAHARQVVWEERPISLEVAPDAETQLVLPTPVRVRVPAAQVSNLTVESFGRHVLLRPAKGAELNAVRLVLQSLTDQQIVIVDVSTSTHADRDPVEIVRPVEPQGEAKGTDQVGDPRITLLRFAARAFYAPPRLRGGLAATQQSVTHESVELLDQADVSATPLASWSWQQLHVTAVQLHSTASTSIDLDPAQLRGNFELAAFHSTRLLTRAPYDRTLVFLVSTRPFGEAIREH